MDFEYLKKNIIFQDHRKYELIHNSELDKIKNNQISNTIIDLIISDIISDKTLQEQFNKYLITTPETTNGLKDDFLNESSENIIDQLAKYQMTNIMNKEFLIFFYFNKKENYSQLIIINHLNLLIESIINNDFKNFSSYSTSTKEKDSNFKFCFMIINIIYESDKENDNYNEKEDINTCNFNNDNINNANDNLRFVSKKSSNISRLDESLK
jgi:hypothetical protein